MNNKPGGGQNESNNHHQPKLFGNVEYTPEERLYLQSQLDEKVIFYLFKQSSWMKRKYPKEQDQEVAKSVILKLGEQLNSQTKSSVNLFQILKKRFQRMVFQHSGHHSRFCLKK
jgi:hypothetical protein